MDVRVLKIVDVLFQTFVMLTVAKSVRVAVSRIVAVELKYLVTFCVVY